VPDRASSIACICKAKSIVIGLVSRASSIAKYWLCVTFSSRLSLGVELRGHYISKPITGLQN